MNRYALLGRGIGYSKSPEIWQAIWAKEGVRDCSFELVDCDDPELFLRALQKDGSWKGFMVTTPYKEWMYENVDLASEVAKGVGAVNAVQLVGQRLYGYNTDVVGFAKSLQHLDLDTHCSALILGSGGASKAVAFALKGLGITSFIVSRYPKDGSGMIGYDHLTPNYVAEQVQLIVNATPLGGPKMPSELPPIPYDALGEGHILYDLSYDRRYEGFFKAAPETCTKINGERMLQLQAEEAWHIFRE